MYVECHILQNFAPSNLNRNDAGSPKDVTFGGYRRGRISSQCLKRAVRLEFQREGLVPTELLGTRTKRLVTEVATRLATKHGKDDTQARAVVAAALGIAGLRVVDEEKTQYLLFVGKSEIDRLTDLCVMHWDALLKSSFSSVSKDDKKSKGNKRDVGVPAEIAREFPKFLESGGKAVDVALFGRMLADLPKKNVEAACQVAHAVSTNKMDVDFDYYTAVDDLKPEDTKGADMIGTVELDSPCFYRYSNVNLDELTRNLEGDKTAAKSALKAYLHAVIAAIPSGKQNSSAAHNPPSLLLFVVRKKGLWSLVNAFANPIVPGKGGDLVTQSQIALDRYWGELTLMYGEEPIVSKALCVLGEPIMPNLKSAQAANVKELIDKTLNAAFSSV
jgi:CRISPR system Cascade subunit CasC